MEATSIGEGCNFEIVPRGGVVAVAENTWAATRQTAGVQVCTQSDVIASYANAPVPAELLPILLSGEAALWRTLFPAVAAAIAACSQRQHTASPVPVSK